VSFVCITYSINLHFNIAAGICIYSEHLQKIVTLLTSMSGGHAVLKKVHMQIIMECIAVQCNANSWMKHKNAGGTALHTVC
jgi:hypothetical protein